jgi:hypothetical protein
MSRPPAPLSPAVAAALAAGRETRALSIGPGALEDTARVFAGQFPGRSAVVVAEDVTHALAGRRVGRLRDGWPDLRVQLRAQHLRRRFTVLDPAVRTGTLDTALAAGDPTRGSAAPAAPIPV